MASDPGPGTIGEILEAARWAPSADNTQPWRFEIASSRHLVVHGSDKRHEVFYDLDGSLSQIAIGALLESIAIAASGHGLNARISYRPSAAPLDESPLFDILFDDDPGLLPDPLLPFLGVRSVNRRPLGRRPLSSDEKAALSRQVELPRPEVLPHRVLWLARGSDKRAMAWIAQRAGKLRLTVPEAYQIHRRIIEWNARFSLDRIPDEALGISRPLLPLMRWIMGRWSRVRFFNRLLGGTLLPRLELDILPALSCSAHFAILAPARPESLTAYVEAGRALCRFWLEATRQGLQLQPEMAPIMFRTYAVRCMAFSKKAGAMEDARKIAADLNLLIGPDLIGRTVFLGRIGRGEAGTSRSLRLPLSDLFTRP